MDEEKIPSFCNLALEQFSISLFYQRFATVHTSLMGFTCLLLIPGSEIAPLCKDFLSYMSAKLCLKTAGKMKKIYKRIM